MTLRRLLLLPAIFLLFLTACQPVQGPHTRPQAPELETVQAETDGNLAEAAEQYLQLAADSEGQKQSLYYLKAAQLFWQLSQVDKAREALANINNSTLTAQSQFDAGVLGAQVALFDSQGDAALKALSQIDEDSLSAGDRLQLLKLRADAYTLTENWLEKANTHLKLEKLLTDTQALEQNRKSLWQALMEMTPQALDQFNPGYPPAVDSGWFALAYNIKAYRDNPETLQVALEDWKRSYPNHPADPALYQDALKAGTQLPRDISDIAILLPGSGPFVEAAKAIKQGIIAAHYASGSSAHLQFYEVESDEFSGRSNVTSQYQAAVSAGAGLVIGPLQKASVEAIAAMPELSVPVLALNRVDERLSRPNLFQFGLAPEDDAEAAAAFARKKGYHHAVVLAPRGEWGDRVANAFNTAWRQEGGDILYQSRYSESENDFRDTLIPLMGLDASEQRYRALKGVLGRSLDFEPRRRQDIDFLFLVARPLKARQLVPQLKFHRSGDLPLIATSHAYTGTPDPQQDIDLNELIITDIPWMFADSNESSDPVEQQLQSQSQVSGGSLLRLYAMGVDAYRLVAELNSMSRDEQQVYHGATGDLTVNGQGQVQREMPWGRFKNGHLEPLN
jgi:hypothetical protein